jgi:hypothetical protein
MEDRSELLGISNSDQTSGEKIELLSDDELREAFLPELDGQTFWHKKAVCDYCYAPFGTDLLVLQKIGRNGLTFMCLSCTKSLFQKLVD